MLTGSVGGAALTGTFKVMDNTLGTPTPTPGGSLDGPTVAVLWLTLLSSYLAAHEALHYAAARLLGCNVRLEVSCGYYTLLCCRVNCALLSRRARALILYTPYTLNALLIVGGLLAGGVVGYMMVLVGVLTLPNMLLEEEWARCRLASLLTHSLSAVLHMSPRGSEKCTPLGAADAEAEAHSSTS